MLYSGQNLHPTHRFYNIQTQPTDPISYSPSSPSRFARFRAQPYNAIPSQSSPQSPNLSNSNIYTKQGILKRNDLGWDGVKLSQYVIEKISDNYEENQKILDKFRKQAEISRRAKKFGHVLENGGSGDEYILPSIISVKQKTSHRYSPAPAPKSVRYLPEQEEEVELPQFRNVGINTSKEYEKVHLQRYLKLVSKYETLKTKYEKQKELRRKERKRNTENQQRRQRQMASLSKIRDIQAELTNISVKLQANNSIIANQIQIKESRRKQISSPKTSRRTKTQPEQFYTQIKDQPQIQEDLIIPVNPVDRFKSKEMEKRDMERMEKLPLVQYTKKLKTLFP